MLITYIFIILPNIMENVSNVQTQSYKYEGVPLKLSSYSNKYSSKYLAFTNEKDELYNVYIKILIKDMTNYAHTKSPITNTLRYVSNMDENMDMDDATYKIKPSLQFLPDFIDYDLTELDSAVNSKDNGLSLLQLSKKWKYEPVIDHNVFFSEIKLLHELHPIYNVKTWDMLYIAAQSEIKSFLIILFADITEVTEIRKNNKNYVCIYSNKFKTNDITYLDTYDTVALWTNCVRLFSGAKPINFEYTDWEVNIFGKDIMEIYYKIEYPLKHLKNKFNKTISQYAITIEEQLKCTRAYKESRPKARKELISSTLTKFHLKARSYWKKYLPYKIIRLYKLFYNATNTFVSNRKLILCNIRNHREITLNKKKAELLRKVELLQKEENDKLLETNKLAQTKVIQNNVWKRNCY